MPNFWSILIGISITLLTTAYLTFFVNSNNVREDKRPGITKKHFSHGTFAIKLEKDRNQEFIR